MRSDMDKVVTERPRNGGGVKAPKGEKRRNQRTPKEDLPKGEKIRQKWETYNNDSTAKQFTDVLGPLYRYLLSKVGEPWDQVWSEVCKNLPGHSMNVRHIRGHIKDFVEVQTVMLDGKVCYAEGMSYGLEITGGYGRYEWQMYVHPDTGVLCKIKSTGTHRFREKQKVGIDVPDEPMKQYHQIDGVWYIVTLAECAHLDAPRHSAGVPRQWRTWEVYDAAYKQNFNRRDLKDKYGKLVYGVSKKQLNRKQIERAGLRKDAA